MEGWGARESTGPHVVISAISEVPTCILAILLWAVGTRQRCENAGPLDRQTRECHPLTGGPRKRSRARDVCPRESARDRPPGTEHEPNLASDILNRERWLEGLLDEVGRSVAAKLARRRQLRFAHTQN